MPVTYMNSSTLSEAITKDQVEFAVGSTANISVGSVLLISKEHIKVAAIPVSGRVQVRRGVNGTYARPHASGEKFWIAATPDVIKSNVETASAVIGVVTNLPDAYLPGMRARDDRGNEFIMVDCSTQVYGGATVNISNDGNFTATVARGGNAQGAVGVMVERGSSDQWSWCQIYGYVSAAQWVGASAANSVNSTYLPFLTTVASTPSVGLDATSAVPTTAQSYYIKGMFIVGVLSSAVTSAASQTGLTFPVFLNYPYVAGYLIDAESASNS